MTADIDREKLRELCEMATKAPVYPLVFVKQSGSRFMQEEAANFYEACWHFFAENNVTIILDLTDAQAAKIAELEALVKDLQVERGELAEHVARSQVKRMHLESERDQVEERFVAGMLEAARIAWKRFDTGSAHKYASNECSAAILSAASAARTEGQTLMKYIFVLLLLCLGTEASAQQPNITFDQPGLIIIFSPDNEVLVKISFDGKITYGPHYTPDATAKRFWEAVGHNAPCAQSK